MSIISTALAFLVALAILIVFHELGHFSVARLCGVKVLRFSVGFGKPLLSVKSGKDQTEWAIAAWPLGGYVKMLDEREGDVAPDELHRAFNRKSVWQRFAVVIAGPVANLLLAVFIYWCILLAGVVETKPIVAAPDANSVAAASGLQQGDTILRVNDIPVATWQDLRWQLLKLIVERAVVKLEVLNVRNELDWRKLDFTAFDGQDLEGDMLARSGLRLFRPKIEPVVGSVVSGSVAERAGLKAGDRVLSADGKTVSNWEELVGIIRTHGESSLTLLVMTPSGERSVKLQPESVQQGGVRIGRIGVAAKFDPAAVKQMTVTVRYGPVAALPKAVARTWETAVFSLQMLGKMLLGQVSWKNLSGPVTIADYAGQSAQLGVISYMGFLALISISLGVLNLLPIPLLDGGHLMYYVVEIIKGSPVSDRVMDFGQRIGLTLLLLLTAFAFYNDINRLISG
jgi:regulator of sigma E protease